jgi:chromosome segregation ATPase
MTNRLSDNIEIYQTELADHFAEETNTDKLIHELESKTELCKLSIANLRSAITQSVKENGRGHPSTLDMSQQLEKLYKNEKQFKATAETKRQKLNSLKAKRENFAKKWKSTGVSSV